MLAAPIPKNEQTRIDTLKSLNVLDTAAEERFDRITRLAQRLFSVSISLVSLIDTERQWFKSSQGLDASETPRDISLCGHAIEQDSVFVVEDSTADERFADNPLVIGVPFLRFYAGYPLTMPNGVRVGTLCIIDESPRHFSKQDVAALEDLGRLVVDELVSVQRSTIDTLTGLSNRCGFEMLAAQVLASCGRHGVDTSLLYFDLDYFKQINDEYGHKEGDFALQSFADLLKSCFRESDVIARFGGDEFVVLLSHQPEMPSTEVLDASVQINIVLQRFSAEIAAHNAKHNRPYELAYSVGVCQRLYTSPLTLQAYLAEADKAMFEVKNQHHQHD
ncbi:sensor domain-containing diguanylate cyclase [Shewanella maritima]|uniref:sensor domain-containing diguanylate cyclase n=1 Tax=Shewanella maritima TaxID=2520507 RepID=UPI0037353879